MKSKLSQEQFDVLFHALFSLFGIIIIAAVTVLMITGKISPWTGRFYSLLDPSYAKNNIPIIASVSEHQPTAWSSFYFDLQLLVFLFPVGLYICFSNLNDANIFIILYGITSIYFAGVMVRLMLVLAPVMCIMGGIAVASLLGKYIKDIDSSSKAQEKKGGKGKDSQQSQSRRSEVSDLEKTCKQLGNTDCNRPC